MDVLNSDRRWLTKEDCEAWMWRVSPPQGFPEPPLKLLPSGTRIAAEEGADGLVDWIEVSFILPRRRISLDMQESIFSIERLVPVSVTITEDTLTSEEIAVQDISLDIGLAEQVDE